MLLFVVSFPILHFATLYLKFVILFFYVLVFEPINVFDEDADEKLWKVGILVHWFGFLFLHFFPYHFTVLTFLFFCDVIEF